MKLAKTSHPASHPHNTLSATSLHSHLLPVPPHSHLYFGYKLPVWHVPPGFVSAFAKDRATIHIHSTHSINTRKHPTPTRLGKVCKRALVVPPSSPHQRTFVRGTCIGTAQVGVSLVSLFDELFKRSRLHCSDVMFDVIFVTHKSIMTIPTPTMWTPPWYTAIHDLLQVLAVPILLKIQ